MKLTYFSIFAALLAGVSAEAHTVLFSENFNTTYTTNFPVTIDGDHLHPAQNLQSLFMDSKGIMQPWRMLKDVSTSSDGYIVSHSIYLPAGTSNDWLCSRPIEIPGEGFILSFDAQSIAFRSPLRPSNLEIFITESPVTSDKGLPIGGPTWVINELPFGDNIDTAVGDFTSYSYSLDEWAGKTIYLNFANRNEDKDLLAIDNIIIQRLDPAEIIAEDIPLILNGRHTLPALVRCTSADGLRDWTLTAKFSNGEEFSSSGITLGEGEEYTLEIPYSIQADERLSYTLTLSSATAPTPIIVSGLIKGLAFTPTHRILMEEATGLWCGNCPIGQYNIESMVLDPEMSDKIVPVSVHVPSSSHANYLVVEEYANMLGMTVAPAFRLEREFVAMTFSQTHDAVYNPSNPESVAGLVRQRAERLTTMDVDITGEFIENNNVTTGIRATVNVVPAISTDPESRYSIGFVLTENNVWLETHPAWAQQNYLATHTELGEVGGWTSLPKVVANVRLQDVARAVYGYTGIANSLPEHLEVNKEYTYTIDLPIPNTLLVADNGTINAPAIVPENCGIVAYIMDNSTNTVVNAAYHPMTEMTEKRFTTADLLASLAVNDIECDNALDAPAEYYTIDGLRAAQPLPGHLYIKKQGTKTAKVVF